MIHLKKNIDRLNENLKKLIALSDTVVYQSHFSKKVLFRSIYDGSEPDGDIIYNTTNRSIFTPYGPVIERDNPHKKLILAIAYWGSPHTSILSLKLLIRLAKLLEHRHDIELWVLGESYPSDEAMVRAANLSNITKLNLHTPVPYHLIPRYLRTADMLLHLKAHEGCSNLVVEAMHTGTPMVGIHSGSLPELVDDAALLANCPQDITKFPDVDIDDLHHKVLYTLDHLDEFSHGMFNRAIYFSEHYLYEQYLLRLKKLASKHD